MKEIHWLCDGMSPNSSGAFEERHPKIVIDERPVSMSVKGSLAGISSTPVF